MVTDLFIDDSSGVSSANLCSRIAGHRVLKPQRLPMRWQRHIGLFKTVCEQQPERDVVGRIDLDDSPGRFLPLQHARSEVGVVLAAVLVEDPELVGAECEMVLCLVLGDYDSAP